jgi:replicative DNA helicase
MAKNKLQDSLQGRFLPYDESIEQAVLGALLLEAKYAMSKISDKLRPEMFYVETNQIIAVAIFEMYKMQQIIDILTVTNHLKKKNQLELVGGPYAITQITNRVASSRSVEFHVMVMTEHYIRRQLIMKNQLNVEKAYDLSIDIFALIGDQQSELNALTENIITDDTTNGYEVVNDALKEIEQIRNSKGLVGIPSGYDDLDNIIMGWQKPDLVIIAGRPGMGKTAFVISMARKIVIKRKKPIGIVSLEMGKTQLIKRLFSVDTEIKGQRIKGAKSLSDIELTKIATQSQLYAPYLLINDKSGLTILQLKAVVRRMIGQGAELIIIDYLQLLKGSKEYRGNREAEISEISRELKGMAKEFGIPVIALAQLSRETEKRKNKEPILSDLRESGAIEQDADIVIFIHRPEYYGDSHDSTGLSLEGIAQLIIAKHRNGPLDTILLHFENQTTAFENRGFAPQQEEPIF